jgi:hypothetical protein
VAIIRKTIVARGGHTGASYARESGTIIHIKLLTAEYTDTMPAMLA